MLAQKGSILCGSVSGCWLRASETKGLAGERRGEAGGNFCGGAIDIIRQPPPNKYRLMEIEILLRRAALLAGPRIQIPARRKLWSHGRKC